MRNGSIKRAIIIGGGIGGLCAAIALRQMGVEAVVYERANALRPVGAGLTIWSNAIRALRHLGVADAVIQAGSKIERGELRTATGRLLSANEPGELETLFGEPTIAIHRADLHRILRAALPDNAVQLDATLVRFEQDADGVRVHFIDQQTAHADLLIGADGIHSVVRQQLFPDIRLRYAGYTAWRGVVEAETEIALGSTSESWGRGSRFGIVPVDKRRVYWFATANTPAGGTLSGSDVQKFLLERFRSWHPPVEHLIRTMAPESILHNDIYDFLPLAQWSRGRVTLLGDAAHATTPNMGQGACMAIESSVILARCLDLDQSLEACLRDYETARKPRTAWITKQSWQIGRFAQVENPLACKVRDLVVGITPDSVLKKRLRQAAGYSI